MMPSRRAAALLFSLLIGLPSAAFAQAAPQAESAQPVPAEAAPPMAAPAPTPVPAAAAAPATAANASLPRDLSPWSMFLGADIVVKAVMVGLLLASVATWTIWLAKSLQLFAARRRARSGLRALTEADDLARATAAGARGPVAALIGTAAEEVARSGGLPVDGIKERTALALGRIEARDARAMGAGTGVLATVGSVAPFVGLFGTVWGIMNSFVGISQAHTSNLAIVAPGIAEALLATAVGLIAAIPAVVIFNAFARATAGYKALLGDASAEVMRHLSRDLDRRAGLRRQAAE